MKLISQTLLKIAGWQGVVIQENPPKSIICVAPHTSNWDFIIGKLLYWSVGRKAGFLMKKSWFFFPMGYLFRAMGGIPVDRSRSNSVVQQMIDLYSKNTTMHLAITPEGTRKANKKWKLGFYHIAVGAQIPIQLAYINFQKKEMGIKEIFYPTGNEITDLTYIYNFYRKNAVPKYSERFELPEN